MWSHWQVPDLYASDENGVVLEPFGMPAVRPKYFTLESPISEWPAWAVTTWWILDPAEAMRRPMERLPC